jgi:hypothetical protein
MTVVSSRGTIGGLLQRTGHDRLYKPGSRKGVLMLYGATSDLDAWFGVDPLFGEVSGICAQQFPLATLSTGVTWGNSTIRTQMSTLRTNIQSSGLFASGKVHLVGVSMGGLCALNWAKANPTLVQSITLLIPVVDVQAVYDADRGGFAASIAAAHGGRPPDSENPADNTGSFTGIPTRLYYSTTDTITLAAEQEASAAGSGATLVSMGAVGHFWGPPWSGRELAFWIKGSD